MTVFEQAQWYVLIFVWLVGGLGWGGFYELDNNVKLNTWHRMFVLAGWPFIFSFALCWAFFSSLAKRVSKHG